MLTKEYKSTVRDQLVDISRQLADATPSCMLLDKSGKPIIIQIEGCSNAGKSLFWDEYTKALLGKSANMIKDFTPKNLPADDEFRYPELWEGKYKQESLKVLFFNAGVCDPCEGAKLLSFICNTQENNEPSPRQHGDILMINQFDEMTTKPIQFDIKINITNTEFHVPYGQDIPEMSRTTNIFVQGEIAKHAPMQKLMAA